MIKGVIFDMDGTMFDTEPISALSWQKAGEKLGISVSMELINKLIGKNPTVVNRLFREYLGEDLDIPAFRAAREEAFNQMILTDGVPFKKGLTDLLAYLKAEQIPRMVATSTSRKRASFVLEQSGIAGDFNAFIYGDDIAASKPDPDIFLAAAKRLQQEPKDCLILEDSVAGLSAGIASGSPVIYIPDVEEVPWEIQEKVTAKVSDLGQVIDWIKKENEGG